MNKLKIMSVFGTRPEAIKMAPLILEMRNNPRIESTVCITAQHRQMLDQVLNIFNITPDYDLDIMQKSQTLEDITSKVLTGLSDVFKKAQPDVVLVHGDTTTSFAAALSAFYNKIKIGHVEAGLRTHNLYSPFPEEANRQLISILSNFNFAPTPANKHNLLMQACPANHIYITGNTVIDALKTTVYPNYSFDYKPLNDIDYTKQIIVVTAHRRENLGQPLQNICDSLKTLAESYGNDIEIIYPVHLNPAVQNTVRATLEGIPNVHLTPPLNVSDLHNLMNKAYFIMTDSGGLQEEAPALGKPVLVLRTETERPEAVESGTVQLAGVETPKILELSKKLLDNAAFYNKMAKATNPYGDGFASRRIVDCLLYEFGFYSTPAEDFVWNK
ncbi:MAG: UDP-N-acetylglucosamine 2-epimerase (non-hydrolyzing) [Clostridiales bacterium]|jgi:UDP-N-acetylglucosamine 2-epimerase|nr:UDP-N-acetylglucosamine 2-epimerase (non-hydrolyzing) [Clostridiales bacterium]